MDKETYLLVAYANNDTKKDILKRGSKNDERIKPITPKTTSENRHMWPWLAQHNNRLLVSDAYFKSDSSGGIKVFAFSFYERLHFDCRDLSFVNMVAKAFGRMAQII